MAERELHDALEEARKKHCAPGISAAVYADGAVVTAACGLTNVVSRVEMTTDTLLHIGSITKIINATLLMQLVESGDVALARPAVDYLPDLVLRDRDALREITVEQLVNHTSGIDGNLLPDAGHDEETIEKTVGRFADAGQLHDPGAARSYCNAGTVIAGYLCQRVAGKSWYDLVKERLFGPLGLERSAVLPEDALLNRSSVGHFIDGSTGLATRTPQTFLPLGYAPAGSTAMMSATDLLAFVRAHLSDGVGPNGARILSSESAQMMRRKSGAISGPSCFDGGIGWMLLPGGLVHHGGGGPGIVSWFVAHPPTQTVVVVLTNADNGFKAINDIVGPLIKSHTGIEPFPAPKMMGGDTPIDGGPFVGSYENNTVVHDISSLDGRLFWSARAKDVYADASPLDEHPPIPMARTENGMFVARPGGADAAYANAITIGFASPVDDRMTYLMQGFRLHRRCATG